MASSFLTAAESHNSQLPWA